MRRRDAEDNLSSRVPPREELRQIALWGVEIFGPAEAERLHVAMSRLGWNDEQLFGLSADPGAWVGEQRTYGSEGSLNLGTIERPGKSRFLLRGRRAPLPESVDYAHGWVFQLSPSVTAVIICFTLKEPLTTSFQTELNLDRRTVNEPLDGGYRLNDVEHAKRKAVELARTHARALIVNWFNAHLPGLFSLAGDGNRLPTAELLTTNSQALLPDEQTTVNPDWVQLITPLGHQEVWKLNELPGLSLCWPGFEGDLRYHGVVNLQTQLLAPENFKYRGEPGDAVYTSLVDDLTRGVLVHFAAVCALREIIRRLRLTPTTLSADTSSRRGTVKCLEQIQHFFDRSVGVPAFTYELATKAENLRSFKWNCSEFQSKPWQPGEEPTQITETLRARTQHFASRAQNLERETREQLEQLSSILSTRENIRTQARMELVTFSAAVVSIASLVVAVMSVDRLSTYVNRQVERLYKSR
jgi:hypothetical protein